jgi:hypothetical protein
MRGVLPSQCAERERGEKGDKGERPERSEESKKGGRTGEARRARRARWLGEVRRAKPLVKTRMPDFLCNP